MTRWTSIATLAILCTVAIVESSVAVPRRIPGLDEVRIELARKKLLRYARHVVRDYETPKHIEEACETLEAVESGEIPRLIWVTPPRHGKSSLGTQIFPNWCLGRNPTWEIMAGSYAASLSVKHSREARNLFTSPESRAVFPEVHYKPERAGQMAVATEKQAAQEWGTTQGGVYYAAGVGGGMTGRGFNIGIIDDPVKDRKEANSPTVSNAVWDWYKSVFYTRRAPNARVIIIMTRWANNDLVGRLLKEMEEGTGDQWHVLHMPAINDADEALWPERWPVDELKRIRSTIGRREFEALYQGNPQPPGGNMFQVDNLVYHDDPTEFPDIPYLRFWDLASTVKERAKDDPDYTAGVLAGVQTVYPKGDDGRPDKSRRREAVDHLWIRDLVAIQQEAPERNKKIVATAERDGPAVKVAVESVGGYKDAHAQLKEILAGRRTVLRVEVSGDKVVRAAPLEPLFEARHVHVLRASWNDILYSQFLAFPSTGEHDDVVDAVSGAYNCLRKRKVGSVPDRSKMRT